MKGKILLIVALMLCVLFARDLKKAGTMANTNLIYYDSILVDGTASVFTQAFAVDRGAYLGLVLEARDDSTAGFDDDSACVSVELYQVFPDTRHGLGFFQVFKSKAHPDSTYPGTDYFLYDSLHIADMDSLAAYDRDYVDWTIKGMTERIYGDSLDSANTDVYYGAMNYIDFAPDFSPALALQLTGKADNLTDGSGSMWIVRVYQMGGDAVLPKEK